MTGPFVRRSGQSARKEGPESPTLTLRKSSDPAAAAAFFGGVVVPAFDPDGPPEYGPTGRRIHIRKDGRRVRRTTVLMREDMARRVDVLGAMRGIDKTCIVHQALLMYLAAVDPDGESIPPDESTR